MKRTMTQVSEKLYFQTRILSEDGKLFKYECGEGWRVFLSQIDFVYNSVTGLVCGTIKLCNSGEVLTGVKM